MGGVSPEEDRVEFSAPDYVVLIVDAAFVELEESAVQTVVPPTDRVWGQRTAYLRDPDGYLIELAQDLGPAPS